MRSLFGRFFALAMITLGTTNAQGAGFRQAVAFTHSLHSWKRHGAKHSTISISCWSGRRESASHFLNKMQSSAMNDGITGPSTCWSVRDLVRKEAARELMSSMLLKSTTNGLILHELPCPEINYTAAASLDQIRASARGCLSKKASVSMNEGIEETVLIPRHLLGQVGIVPRCGHCRLSGSDEAYSLMCNGLESFFVDMFKAVATGCSRLGLRVHLSQGSDIHWVKPNDDGEIGDCARRNVLWLHRGSTARLAVLDTSRGSHLGEHLVFEGQEELGTVWEGDFGLVLADILYIDEAQGFRTRLKEEDEDGSTARVPGGPSLYLTPYPASMARTWTDHTLACYNLARGMNANGVDGGSAAAA